MSLGASTSAYQSLVIIRFSLRSPLLSFFLFVWRITEMAFILAARFTDLISVPVRVRLQHHLVLISHLRPVIPIETIHERTA